MSAAYYMSREHELKKQPDAMTMFDQIGQACGDSQTGKNVFWALWCMWDFEHALDDVLDSGKLDAEDKEKLLRQCHQFIHALLTEHPNRDQATYFMAKFMEAVQQAGFTAEDTQLAVKSVENFAMQLVNNPFFYQHAPAHRAMFDMMIMRCIAGDEMARGSEKQRRLAPAVRCADIDFMVHVAMLAGGWELARKLTSLRDYDEPD